MYVDSLLIESQAQRYVLSLHLASALRVMPATCSEESETTRRVLKRLYRLPRVHNVAKPYYSA
jgi:hypothetical protein